MAGLTDFMPDPVGRWGLLLAGAGIVTWFVLSKRRAAADRANRLAVDAITAAAASGNQDAQKALQDAETAAFEQQMKGLPLAGSRGALGFPNDYVNFCISPAYTGTGY